MKKNLSDSEKFSLVRREAIYTGFALVGLIIFWLIAGFGMAGNFSSANLGISRKFRRMDFCYYYQLHS